MPNAPKSYPQDSQEAVGERLELIRLAMGYTNEYLADLIGIQPQKWNNYKAGRNMIPPQTAGKLCSVTGATTDFIYRNVRSDISPALTEKLQKVETPAKAPAKRA